MKRILWSILLMALLISACSSTSAAPTTISFVKPQQTDTQSPTQGVVQPATPEPGLVAAEPGCTVASPNPTPGPTMVALFPAATEEDWTRGPLTAVVTIMEYSDFQ